MPAATPPPSLWKGLSAGVWTALTWLLAMTYSLLTSLRIPGPAGMVFDHGNVRWLVLGGATTLTLAGAAALVRRPLLAVFLLLAGAVCGAVALQAGSANLVIDTQPAVARQALRTIESASRETLAGLRRILVALREADPEHSTPTPGLDDLQQMAKTTSDAGLTVDLRWEGERRTLPPEIDVAAYRIIQEAITNVARHADARSCRVSIDYQDDDLVIEVIDHGKGISGDTGSGYGLIGMRERVSLLHGDFCAAPRPEGGFRVTARLPTLAGAR